MDGPWGEPGFNLTAGEARQLAAQLVPAADSHDSPDQNSVIMRRLEKIANHVGCGRVGA